MEGLQKLSAVARRDDAERRVDVDLFLLDGTYCGLHADPAQVRRVLDATHVSLIHLEAEEEGIATSALVVGWPWPLRTGRLLLHAVEEGEEILVHSRVSLPDPVPAAENGAILVPHSPWVHVRGALPAVANRLTIPKGYAARGVALMASEAHYPLGVTLLTSPGQVIYRAERQSAGEVVRA